MKVITLLLAVAGVSACVPKPYMAGSLNDRKGPPSLDDISDYVHTSIPGGPQAPAAHSHSGTSGKEQLNPVGHTSSNPMR
jgi:hypothetical protein